MNISKCFKRFIALSFCVLIVVTTVPLSVYAENDTTTENQTKIELELDSSQNEPNGDQAFKNKEVLGESLDTPITYTIRFNINDGFSHDTELQFPVDMVMHYGEEKEIPDFSLAKHDEFFVGWAEYEYADRDDVKYFTGQKVKNLSSTDGDIVELYAVYEEYETRIAAFLSDDYDWGYTEPFVNMWTSNVDTYPGSSTAKPMQGYRFVEWQYIDGEKVTGENGETLEGAKIIPALHQDSFIVIYVAHFEPDTAQYTINYYREGGNDEYSLWKTNVDQATTESTVTAPILDPGFGYHHDSDVPGTLESGQVTGDGSLVLSVYYTRNKYSVTFNTMGGTGISEQMIKYNDKAVRPENPTRKGYTFDGWYTTDQYLYEYDFDNPIDRNITIYAKWNPISYAIKYNLNGGSFPDDQAIIKSYTIESDTFQIVNPEKEGYVFNGWNGTGVETPSKNVVVPKGSTGNMNFVAHWGVEEKYEIIEGVDTVIDFSDFYKAIFKADIPFEEIHHIEVDDKTISTDLFIEWVDSIYVQLKEDFLKTLAPGKHTIKIVAKDGGYAKTTFNLTSNAATTVEPKKPIAGNTNTGDDFDIVLWLLMIAIAIIVIVKRKKRFV